MNNNVIIKLIKRAVEQELNKRIQVDLNSKFLFSKKEAAHILSVSTRTIDRWRNDGTISSIETAENGRVLFSKEQIEKLVKTLENGR
jgi:excisionase family DNA binding protein